jgi:hypothetical protein
MTTNESGTAPTETKTRTRSTRAKAETKAVAEESKTDAKTTANSDETKGAEVEVNASTDTALDSGASNTVVEGEKPSGDASADTGENTPPTEETKADAEGNNQAAVSNADKLPEATENTALTGEVSSQDALTPFQLRVENRGKRAICHVSKTVIPEGDTVVITYQSTGQKDLARGNFEQVNALSYGGKRYIVEG